MKHRLYIVEGLPCSGKSTISAYVASILNRSVKTGYIDEGTGEHPADYEFHALAPAGLIADQRQIVSLAEYSGELLQSLMPYKIYDALSWEEEMPLMMDRWQQFVNCAQTDTTYVFNCIFLQNPMCETMMRFGFDEAVSKQYIDAIANIIRPMNPVVIYLKNDTIAASVVNASSKRPGWLEAVIDYHIHGAYGVSIGADGFEGYIRCLQERQMRELRILDQLPVKRIVLDNPQLDWKGAKEQLKSMIVNM